MSRLNLSIDGDDAMSPTSDSPKAKSNTKPKSSPANRRSATFTYDGEEIPRDDLCDMLDKIYKTHDETQAKRSKCHTGMPLNASYISAIIKSRDT